MVRFALDLDINHVTRGSYEDKCSTESGDSIVRIRCDNVEPINNVEPKVNNSPVDTSPHPSSRFSITQFPTGPIGKTDTMREPRYFIKKNFM